MFPLLFWAYSAEFERAREKSGETCRYPNYRVLFGILQLYPNIFDQFTPIFL